MKNFLFGLLLVGFNLNAQTNLPNIQLSNLEGKKVSSTADFSEKDQLYVFSFWATWCTPCIKELNNIDEIYQDWQKKYGLELVAVSMDDARTSSKVQPVANSLGWSYLILLDENKDLARAMNVNNPPQTILIDQSGNIVYVHNGYTEGSEIELEEQIKKLIKP